MIPHKFIERWILLFQICVRLSDCGPNKCRTASKEKISHLGALRGLRPATGQRINDIPESECEISKAEQALAADSLGHEYRDPR